MPCLKWSYGVQTVPSRRGDLLPRTLASLKAAGFPEPRLFVDGCNHRMAQGYEDEFRLSVTSREPTIRTAGNWVLALHELYLREPSHDRFVLFQDDAVFCRNLRQYLERCPYPEKSFLNLTLFPSNEALIPLDPQGRRKPGWFVANQNGRGAVALVFDREAVMTLLSHRHLVDRVQDVHRGHKAIDGGVVECLSDVRSGAPGWKEYCHFPALLAHVGEVSSMNNRPHRLADCFVGSDFDALTLLSQGVPV